MRAKKLIEAKKAKNDEFYTQIEDIQRELKHYKPHFKNKRILMNADNPDYSQFWKYFKDNFDNLGLLSITATHFTRDEESFRTDFDGKTELRVGFSRDGDFRSQEVVEILKGVDIVVTNPPFSLFKDLIAQLTHYSKDFILIGHQNAITQKAMFNLIKNNEIWLGRGFAGNVGYFHNHNYENYAVSGKHIDGMIRVSGVFWYTNLTLDDGRQPLTLTETYTSKAYPTYDNYDAINVDRVLKIPKDYYGEMGVPITFMNKYVKEQFEIIGLDSYIEDGPRTRFQIDGKTKYARIVIKRKTKEV